VSTAFSGHEERWQARLGKLRDVVRQELVARQLAAELPPRPVRIIDLGCGQGTQALALARRGYEVTGVDASAELLARFERDLAAEPAEVRARVRVERGLIEDWAERSVVSRAGAVLCPPRITTPGRSRSPLPAWSLRLTSDRDQGEVGQVQEPAAGPQTD
jgi:S-adenosylmethionine-dependent methyltransferase